MSIPSSDRGFEGRIQAFQKIEEAVNSLSSIAAAQGEAAKTVDALVEPLRGHTSPVARQGVELLQRARDQAAGVEETAKERIFTMLMEATLLHGKAPVGSDVPEEYTAAWKSCTEACYRALGIEEVPTSTDADIHMGTALGIVDSSRSFDNALRMVSRHQRLFLNITRFYKGKEDGIAKPILIRLANLRKRVREAQKSLEALKDGEGKVDTSKVSALMRDGTAREIVDMTRYVNFDERTLEGRVSCKGRSLLKCALARQEESRAKIQAAKDIFHKIGTALTRSEQELEIRQFIRACRAKRTLFSLPELLKMVRKREVSLEPESSTRKGYDALVVYLQEERTRRS